MDDGTGQLRRREGVAVGEETDYRVEEMVGTTKEQA